MSIEQHTGPDAASESADAALAHVLADLTRAVLDLPAAAPPAPASGPDLGPDPEAEEQPEPQPDEGPERRRPGTLLHELSFLDD